jgi:hypothetical protein
MIHPVPLEKIVLLAISYNSLKQSFAYAFKGMYYYSNCMLLLASDYFYVYQCFK